MENFKEEGKQLIEDVKEHYGNAESTSDGFLQKLKDSPFTALILGGIIGGSLVFLTIAC